LRRLNRVLTIAKRAILGMQVVVEPREVTLHPVMDIARTREQMKLFGIDHQFSGNSERAKRLVHLFAADNGNVEIALPAHKKRWRVNTVGNGKKDKTPSPRLPAIFHGGPSSFVYCRNVTGRFRTGLMR